MTLHGAYNEPVYLHMNVTARSFWYVNASKSFFLSKCCRQINRRLSAEQLEMDFCVCVCLCLRVLFPNTHMRATSCCLLTADNAVEIDDTHTHTGGGEWSCVAHSERRNSYLVLSHWLCEGTVCIVYNDCVYTVCAHVQPCMHTKSHRQALLFR